MYPSYTTPHIPISQERELRRPLEATWIFVCLNRAFRYIFLRDFSRDSLASNWAGCFLPYLSDRPSTLGVCFIITVRPVVREIFDPGRLPHIYSPKYSANIFYHLSLMAYVAFEMRCLGTAISEIPWFRHASYSARLKVEPFDGDVAIPI